MIYNRDKFLNFVESRFEEGQVSQTSNGEEYRTICPFCHGGDSHEISFDINLDQGVVRCWRASCSYSASAAWMVKELLGVDYPKALEIVSIGSGDDEILSALLGQRGPDMFADIVEPSAKIEAWVDSFEKIEDIDKFPTVAEWIEGRNYDPYKFLEQHDLYYPIQEGRFEDRVIFRIETNYNHAYLGYGIHPEVKPKTMNPPKVKLTNMLYNYNDCGFSKVVFVCEGIFDSARLKYYGLSAVSIFGSVISETQNHLISRMRAEEIVICLDNGLYNKSLNFARKLADISTGKTISVIDIEREGADPDELSEDELLYYFSRRKVVKAGESDVLRALISRGLDEEQGL